MFVYAAILMYVEPRIAHRKSNLDPRVRLRLVYLACFIGCIFSVLYLVSLVGISQTGWARNISLSYSFNTTLFTVLVIVMLTSFMSTIFSGFLLGVGEPSNYVIHPVICIGAFIISIILITGSETLLDFGLSLGIAEFMGLVFLFYRVNFAKTFRKKKHI